MPVTSSPRSSQPSRSHKLMPETIKKNGRPDLPLPPALGDGGRAVVACGLREWEHVCDLTTAVLPVNRFQQAESPPARPPNGSSPSRDWAGVTTWSSRCPRWSPQAPRGPDHPQNWHCTTPTQLRYNTEEQTAQKETTLTVGTLENRDKKRPARASTRRRAKPPSEYHP